MSDLIGVSVVVTRASAQAGLLNEKLRAQGATVIEFPVIQIVDPTDSGAELRSHFDRLGCYDWVMVTSTNTAERIASLISQSSGVKVAAIGIATSHTLSEYGIDVTFVPRNHTSKGLLDEFPNGPGRVLLPQGNLASPALADGLREKGWNVDAVEAYRTMVVSPDSSLLEEVRCADVITFTSPSTVTNYLQVAGDSPIASIVVCIGPTTAEKAQENGLFPVTASTATNDGLVEAIATAVRK